MKPGDVLYWLDEHRPPGPAAKLWVRSGRVMSYTTPPDQSYCVWTDDTKQPEWLIGKVVYTTPERANIWAFGVAVRLCLNFRYQTVEVYQHTGGMTSRTPIVIPEVFRGTTNQTPGQVVSTDNRPPADAEGGEQDTEKQRSGE